MGLGGPVWHASAAPTSRIVSFGPEILAFHAFAALEGVGDAALGEWTEFTGYAFHVRRRLSAAEQSVIGPVVDIRGTPEARWRAEKVRKYVRRGRMGEAVWLEETGQSL